MKEIPLTQGFTALVDDEDYEWLSRWRWHFGTGGYAMRAGGTVRMHNELMKPPPGFEVDHANGDGMDNRRRNLVVCTRSENNRGAFRRVEYGRWLSQVDAGRLLGLRSSDVCLLIHAGELPVVDFRSRLMLPRAEVLPFESEEAREWLAGEAADLRHRMRMGLSVGPRRRSKRQRPSSLPPPMGRPPKPKGKKKP